MSVWYKEGVCGDLTGVTQKGLGKVARLYDSVGADLYVTAIRDGNHTFGSFHYIGQAFDFRKHPLITLSAIKNVLGKDFDVIEHSTHYHVEYDPK